MGVVPLPRTRPRELLSMSRRRLPLLPLLLPLLLAPLLQCLAGRLLNWNGQWRNQLSQTKRMELIEALREEVRPTPPHLIGGEVIDDHVYERFLQVQGWSVSKASEMLRKDLAWRRRFRPRALRPRDAPTACSQRGWLVLMRQQGSGALICGDELPGGEAASVSKHTHQDPPAFLSRFRLRPAFGRSLHPPHEKPMFVQWVHTRHGMPVTYINVREWRPERYRTRDECTRFCAYHMEHYIRRMPMRRGRCGQRASPPHSPRACTTLPGRTCARPSGTGGSSAAPSSSRSPGSSRRWCPTSASASQYSAGTTRAASASPASTTCLRTGTPSGASSAGSSTRRSCPRFTFSTSRTPRTPSPGATVSSSRPLQTCGRKCEIAAVHGRSGRTEPRSLSPDSRAHHPRGVEPPTARSATCGGRVGCLELDARVVQDREHALLITRSAICTHPPRWSAHTDWRDVWSMARAGVGRCVCSEADFRCVSHLYFFWSFMPRRF